MAKGLTKRQREILDFIADCLEARGVAPTQREIRDQFGYSSYGTVYKHLDLLEKKGYIWRDWNQKRGILLLRPMPGREHLGGERELPLRGRISAGHPIEEIEARERLTVPAYLLDGSPGEHYLLEVQGTDLIDEGMQEGDLLIVESRDQAEPGEMVVALLGGSAVLHRIYPEDEGNLRLEPAHPTKEAVTVPSRQVQIQGAVVGLMRRY